MSRSYQNSLGRHQSVSLLYAVFRDAKDQHVKFTAHVGKKLLKDQDPIFEVLESKASTTTSLSGLNKNAWKDETLTPYLGWGVKLEYYFGTPGYLSITTTEKARGYVKDCVLELIGYHRSCLLAKEQEPLSAGLEHYMDYLELPPYYEYKGRRFPSDEGAGSAFTLTSEERPLPLDLMGELYNRLEGYPVRQDLLLLMSRRYGLECEMNGENVRVLKAERKVAKTKPKVEHVKAERIHGVYVDVVTGKTIEISDDEACGRKVPPKLAKNEESCGDHDGQAELRRGVCGDNWYEKLLFCAGVGRKDSAWISSAPGALRMCIQVQKCYDLVVTWVSGRRKTPTA